MQKEGLTSVHSDNIHQKMVKNIKLCKVHSLTKNGKHLILPLFTYLCNVGTLGMYVHT
jgi:hypothetical protein